MDLILFGSQIKQGNTLHEKKMVVYRPIKICLCLFVYESLLFIQDSGIWSKPNSDNFTKCIDLPSNHKSMKFYYQTTFSCHAMGYSKICLFSISTFFFGRTRCKDQWLHSRKCKWWPESDEIWGQAVFISDGKL